MTRQQSIDEAVTRSLEKPLMILLKVELIPRADLDAKIAIRTRRKMFDVRVPLSIKPKNTGWADTDTRTAAVTKVSGDDLGQATQRPRLLLLPSRRPVLQFKERRGWAKRCFVIKNSEATALGHLI